MPRRPVKRTSDLLREIMALPDQGSISIGELIASFGARSFALAILVFSLPNSLPIPSIPGFSTVTGLPILFIALQLILGKKTIWLPHRIADKQFSQETLVKIFTKALPVALWLEKLMRPRWVVCCESYGERVIGALILILSLILILPIPGGNFFPGLSISLLALALLERDGLLAAIAVAAAVGSLAVMYKVAAVALHGIVNWLAPFF